MIYDDEDRPLTYWPISGLREGSDSQHIFIRIDTPRPGEILQATMDSRVTVFGRVGDSGPFTNLAQGLDLTGVPAGRTRFEIYAHANSPIEGLERVTLSVGAVTSGPAGWQT